MASSSLGSIVGNLLQAYSAETDKRTKIIDLYMACILLTGIVQFVYCALVGTFPFNSFLSGFLCTVAMFVLTGASPRAAPRAHRCVPQQVGSLRAIWPTWPTLTANARAQPRLECR